MASKVS